LSIRRKIIERYKAGESTKAVRSYGYCVSGVRRMRQRYEETGSLEPRKTKPGMGRRRIHRRWRNWRIAWHLSRT
jgi:hypothetical protein